MLTRRAFLQSSSLVSLFPVLPQVLSSTARAAGAAADAPALVVVQLDGGNDGINTVVPYADDAYARVRDALRLPTDRLHRLDDDVALHPSMRPAKELFDDGRLTIVQGVGYPNPSRSHFQSMRIWHTAQLSEAQKTGYGWLGRALDRRSDRAAAGDAAAIHVGDDAVPEALWGRKAAVTSLVRADDLQLDLPTRPVATPPDVIDDATLSQFVSRQVLSAYGAADEFAKGSRRAAGAEVDYPDSALSARLRLIADLLRSDSQARIFYTVQSGYDTHAAQLFTHARLLRDFASALQAFLDDLRVSGLEERVVVLAFSEFGRRVRENDSQGTDHGTAGPVFLAGAPVRGGLVGQTSNLSDLEADDLKTQFDFRQIYATLLDGWLAVDSEAVLGETFPSLPILDNA